MSSSRWHYNHVLILINNILGYRGQYYGVAAAIGKIGAFVGSWVFPVIQSNAPNNIRAGQDPFFIGSALAIFSGFLALFFVPDISQDTIEEEDLKFREYLSAHGYDVSKMGVEEYVERSKGNLEVNKEVQKD